MKLFRTGHVILQNRHEKQVVPVRACHSCHKKALLVWSQRCRLHMERLGNCSVWVRHNRQKKEAVPVLARHNRHKISSPGLITMMLSTRGKTRKLPSLGTSQPPAEGSCPGLGTSQLSTEESRHVLRTSHVEIVGRRKLSWFRNVTRYNCREVEALSVWIRHPSQSPREDKSPGLATSTCHQSVY